LPGQSIRNQAKAAPAWVKKSTGEAKIEEQNGQGGVEVDKK